MSNAIAQLTRNSTLAVIAAVTLISALPQSAEARPSTRSFSCEGVRDLIYDRGALVMNTKNASVYRRFVNDRSFCAHGEGLESYYAPTRSGKCRLKICRDLDFDRDNRRIWR